MSVVVVDVVEYLVCGIVDNFDDVWVDLIISWWGCIVEVYVYLDDLGKVIGCGGCIVIVLCILVVGIGGCGICVDVVDID